VTAIEWTDITWNPTTGCDRVSPGCDNCYALTLAKRLKGMGSAKYQNDGDPRTSGPGFGITEHPDTLSAPLGWRKPRKVFVNSMSDLFHDRISDDFIAQVFAVMAATPRHTYQILTKRHGRMRSLLSKESFRRSVGIQILRDGEAQWRAKERHAVPSHWPLRNVWLGVSVENQQWADIRIPALLDTPASVRWLSCEPLLGPVDLDGPVDQHGHRPHLTYWLTGRPHWGTPDGRGLQPIEIGPRIDWVVAGGESGPGARPMNPDWARLLRDQCTAAEVPFHFKQRGEWTWAPHGEQAAGFVGPQGEWSRDLPRTSRLDRWHAVWRVGKGRSGRVLDGRTWDQYPVAVGEDTPQ
jgi:protein gp37